MNEDNNSKPDLNFDLADFHGLEPIRDTKSSEKSDAMQNSIYRSPEADLDEPFYYDNRPRLGVTLWLFSLFNIMYSALIIVGVYSIKNEILAKGWSHLYTLFWGMAVIQLVAYVGLLCKQNWARKIVVFLNYPKLLVLPIGTIEAIVTIKRLKGKKF